MAYEKLGAVLYKQAGFRDLLRTIPRMGDGYAAAAMTGDKKNEE